MQKPHVATILQRTWSVEVERQGFYDYCWDGVIVVDVAGGDHYELELRELSLMR